MSDRKSKTDARSALFQNPALAACFADLDKARHLPGYMYNSPEVFEAEKDILFMRDWIVVGREDEIPNKGDYRTVEFAGESIVISRDNEGALAAFVNSCRHRGAPVASGSGNLKTFDCPWHGWAYDLQGKLISAHRPRQMQPVDPELCRMPPLRIDSFGGFIFVNFDHFGPTLAEFLDVDGFRDEVAFLRSDELQTVHTYSYDIDANWKFVHETLADVYHVEIVHRSSFGNTAIGYKPQTTADVKLTKYGSRKFYSSGTSAPDGVALFGPMPWLKDHPKGNLFAMSFYLRPNFAFFARCDMVQPWVALPLSPTKTRIAGWTCMPKEFTQAPAFKEKMALISDYCLKQNGEDKELILALQKGTRSRFYPQGQLHELESLVHQRVRGYLRAMTGDGDAR